MTRDDNDLPTPDLDTLLDIDLDSAETALWAFLRRGEDSLDVRSAIGYIRTARTKVHAALHTESSGEPPGLDAKP